MIRVGVMRGGISPEYEVSLNTGGNVISHLRSDKLNQKYKAIDILIDRDGFWHMDGRPIRLDQLADSVDVVFNALHGDFGEDGKVQQILEEWNIPYTGSGTLSSILGYNKVLTKEQFDILGIKTPNQIVFSAYNKYTDGPKEIYAKRQAKVVFEKFSSPWIIKPVSSGSSMSINVCKTYPELIYALELSTDNESDILVEEFINGREASVGVINNFRNKEIYTLPAIEIRLPQSKTFFDYDSKYSGISDHICPGNFTYKEKEELGRLASLIHTGLNLSHYSRSDFIVHPKRGIYALEVNTLPGLTEESLTPKSLESVGSTMPEFISHIIKLTLE